MTERNIRKSHPDGHFYSPIIDPELLVDREMDLWPETPHVEGIDFNPGSHEKILTEYFPQHIGQYDYPEELDETPGLTQFFTKNSQFSWLDARSLFVLLNAWQPERVLEVGSGFSSLLTADVNHRFMQDRMDFKCIEPYPREFLRKNVPGLSRLVENKVEDIPLSEFMLLDEGDILFIDSSHVAKTGSDVNFLVFEVLPRLKSGVLVHIHDIFLPFEYPKDWVLSENRSWNEQYVIRALLMYSYQFEVVFGCSYAQWRFSDLVKHALNLSSGASFGGGSLWIRKK